MSQATTAQQTLTNREFAHTPEPRKSKLYKHFTVLSADDQSAADTLGSLPPGEFCSFASHQAIATQSESEQANLPSTSNAGPPPGDSSSTDEDGEEKEDDQTGSHTSAATKRLKTE